MFAPGPTSQRQYAKGVGGVFVVSLASLLILISTWRTLNLEALGQFQKSSMTNAQPPVLQPTVDESLNKSIVVLTWSDRLHKYPKTALMNRLYAKRHGYRRVVAHERLQPQLHQAWEKIVILHHMLQETSVSAVLWVDDDAFVRKQSITIEYWLEKYPNADLIIASGDANNQPPHALNSGVMIFRNTPWSQHFLNDVLHSKDCDYESRTCCWEQDCMKKRVKESDFEFRVAEIPLGEFNCQTIHHAYKGECNPWVWHAMGQGQKGTLEQMAEVVMAEVADVVYVSEEQIIPKSINEYIHKFQKSSMTNAQPHKIEFGCTPENFVQSPRECERGLQESNQMMAWIRDQPAFGVGVWKSVDNQVLDNVSIAVVKPSCKVAMHRLEQSIPGFRFTSTAEALRMLSNKHIVLLGDSLMRGTYYDICARQTPKTSLLLRLELQISLM